MARRPPRFSKLKSLARSVATVSRGEVRVGFGAARIYQLAAANALHCRIIAADSEQPRSVCAEEVWSRSGKWKESGSSRQKTAGKARKIERKQVP
jgi:hypothetical protein